jgi:(S)-2-hydroxy-acid oxidase
MTISEFNQLDHLDCTGDVVTDDVVRFDRAIFTGHYPNSSFSHVCTLLVLVLKDSYGEAKQQHTFTCLVIDCDTGDYSVAQQITIKGRNLYRNGCRRAPWSFPDQRNDVLNEKHQRGSIARAARSARKSGF